MYKREVVEYDLTFGADIDGFILEKCVVCQITDKPISPSAFEKLRCFHHNGSISLFFQCTIFHHSNIQRAGNVHFLNADVFPGEVVVASVLPVLGEGVGDDKGVGQRTKFKDLISIFTYSRLIRRF